MAVPGSVNPSVLQGLQEQMSRLALATPPENTAPALNRLSEPMHPRVKAFFEEQERIAQQPAPEMPMRLPRELYEQADAGAIASINSPDWRKQKISIVATEITYDLFCRELRAPIVAATRKVAPLLLNSSTPPEEKQRIKDTHLIKRFSMSVVPESERRHCFVVQQKEASSIVVAVPYTLLSELSMKFFQYTNEQSGRLAGCCLSTELQERAKNIMRRLFQPEWQCFEAFSKSGKAPIVTYRTLTIPVGPALIEVSALDEAAQRMLQSGFPLEVTRSLLGDVCRRDPRLGDKMLSLIILGRNEILDKQIGW